MEKEGSEIKWECDHLESRQVSVWWHHSYGTKAHSPARGYPISSS